MKRFRKPYSLYSAVRSVISSLCRLFTLERLWEVSWYTASGLKSQCQWQTSLHFCNYKGCQSKFCTAHSTTQTAWCCQHDAEAFQWILLSALIVLISLQLYCVNHYLINWSWKDGSVALIRSSPQTFRYKCTASLLHVTVMIPLLRSVLHH